MTTTTTKAIVTLPDVVATLAGETSNAGRRQSKGWLKVLTGVDTDKANGYAFLGSFVNGERAELEVGTWLLGYGEDRRHTTAVALWQVTADGLTEVKRWTRLQSPWALGCRDEIAALISAQPDRDALVAERAALVARLAEIDALLA